MVCPEVEATLPRGGGVAMSIELMFLLFLISVILCGVGGAVVKRREIQVPKMALIIFHLIYITGLVAVYIRL